MNSVNAGTVPTDGTAPRKTGAKLWLPLVAGALLAFALLQYASHAVLIKLESAAFGAETTRFAQGKDKQAQCADSVDSALCIAAWRRAGSPPSVMWFGNSQLEGINRFKMGDVNAPELVHRALAERGYYSVSYSQPNANLTEEAIVWNAVAPIYHPKLLILPVCYDDIREQGVRDSVRDMLDVPGTRARLRAQAYWPLVASSVGSVGSGGTDTDAAGPQTNSHRTTVQADVEQRATAFLEQHWRLWEKRPELRGTLGYAIHVLRNQIVGIHSTTKRAVDAGVYRDRMALIDGMVADARAQGIDVLLYVPPYRQDIDGPYPMNDYRVFKTELRAIAARHGAGFADIDNVVPGPEWATVPDSLFGFTEPDFMHFTATGHRSFAAAIDKAARRMGY